MLDYPNTVLQTFLLILVVETEPAKESLVLAGVDHLFVAGHQVVGENEREKQKSDREGGRVGLNSRKRRKVGKKEGGKERKTRNKRRKE
jgi:hypothetical protein